jgi:hypothetical protein
MSRFGISAIHPQAALRLLEQKQSQSSRTSRFLVESKSELKPDTPIALINPEYPYTLDLRHYWKAKN